MADKKIKVVVLDGLDADDVLKLKHGGFFDGVSMPLPQGATGQAATLKVPEAVTVRPGDTVQVPLNSLTPVRLLEPTSTEHAADVRDALEKAEAQQEAAVEAQGSKAGLFPDGLFPHDPPQPEQKARRKKTTAEDRDVERVANAKDERVAEIAKAVAPEAAQQFVQDVVAPFASPTGNGKKYAAKHARQNGRYVVASFGKKWTATFIARTKGGLAFKLDGYDNSAVTLDEDTVIEELSVDGAAAPTDEQVQDTSEVDLSIDTLLSFTKLRDLIQYVVSTGIHPTGVAAFCESMKNDVPLLQRITNIEERVTRTLEVMGYAEGK